MTLPDGPRQIVAALVAAAVFLALFFAANLVWFVALPLAVIAYGALLLIIRRRPLLSDILLSEHVTAADIAAGEAALDEALRRLGKAEAASDPDVKDDLSALATELRSIRTQIADDPGDFRIARRFIVSYLPKLVENVESYVSLAAVATGPARDRLAPLRDGIRAYHPTVARIAQAGLENNFRALEAEIDALGFQLKRG
jgi:5-bromo-4-chloroindolyl phosphate hydrolysis protein